MYWWFVIIGSAVVVGIVGGLGYIASGATYPDSSFPVEHYNRLQ